MTSQYHRVLLKLSGETFADEYNAISPSIVGDVADQLVEVAGLGVQIGVVVGGGNIIRGAALSATGMERSSADHMGMLATVINSLALQDACEKRGVATRVQTAVMMQELAEPYIRRRAVRHLEKGRIVIFAAGLGAPYFSTDTAAAQRALEIGAEAIFKGTKVDGVYDDDPRTNPDAVKYDRLDYITVLQKGLRVMDATAISLCMDNGLPIVVFNMLTKGNIRRAVSGEPIGTIVQ